MEIYVVIKESGEWKEEFDYNIIYAGPDKTLAFSLEIEYSTRNHVIEVWDGAVRKEYYRKDREDIEWELIK